MKSAKRIISAVLATVIVLSMTACSQRPKEIDTSTELGASMQTTAKYVYKKMTNNPKQGKEMGVLALLKSGYMDYWDDRARNYVINMNTFIQRGGDKIANKKEILWDQYPIVFETYTACGIYANKTASADLSQGITVDAITLMGGYDNKINCLTALECGGLGVYQTYEYNGDLDREKLVDFVLSLQNEDGSFSYDDMKEGLTVTKVTADAVIALKSTTQTSEITAAANKGAEYLLKTVKPTDEFYDVCVTIIALNYADIDATDYVKGLMTHQYSDGSYSRNSRDSNGNLTDSSYALFSIASQYRYENNLSKVYDFSESYGMAHNKLSPLWTKYLNLMKFVLGFMICFLIGLYIRSRIRIAKWRKEGIYNETAHRMYTDAELAEIQRQKDEHAKKLAEAESTDEMNVETVTETTEPVAITETEEVTETASEGDEASDDSADGDE